MVLCLLFTSLISVNFASANTVDYNQKLKVAYDPWNKTEQFNLTDKGIYIQSIGASSNPGFNFKDKQFKEKEFSLSFINPIYNADGTIIDENFYRTSVQISLKDGNNTLRFNFSDSGNGAMSKLQVLLIKGSDNYTFTLNLIGNMTEDYEYQVVFDYNSQDMIKTRIVNSVPTDIFKTGSYDASAFKANVGGLSVGIEGDTVAEKVENFKNLIKDTFKNTVYFEPYVQLWGDLGNGETKRKLYITEHNGQRFDNGAEYLVNPFVTEIVQYMAVEENTDAKMAFTGATSYLQNPTRFETDTPGYKVNFYAMIYREPVYNDNIKNIKVTLINGEERNVVHNGGGWNVEKIPVGNAGNYQLEVEVTSQKNRVFVRSFDFEVVKKDRIELTGKLNATYKEGEDVLIPTANLVTNGVTGETVTPTVKNGDSVVAISDGKIINAQSGNYTVIYESGEIKVEKTFTVIAKNKQLVGLQINKPPAKLIYEEGEVFDMTGLMIQKKYSDGSLEEIWGGFSAVTDKALKITDKNAVVMLTDEYGVTAYLSIPIVVDVPEITELLPETVAIIKTPNLCYVVGETFNVNGLQIKVIFNDNTEKIITEGFTVDNLNALTLSDDKVTVSFTIDGFDLSCEVPIIVDEKPTAKTGCNSKINSTPIIAFIVVAILVIYKINLKEKNYENKK